MRNKEGSALIKKFLDGNCTPEELARLDEWYNTVAKENSGTPFSQNLLIQQEARLEMLLYPNGKEKNAISTLLWNHRITFAATLTLIVATAAILFINNRKYNTANDDVSPGKNAAMLTLSSGKRIDLTRADIGQVIRTPGLVVSKTADGQILFESSSAASGTDEQTLTYNTVETPIGGQYKVVLPDHSSVWLNANSVLKFPTSFSKGIRKVNLSGEGYFEITKDKEHPFIVASGNQLVKVLGTHFNVNDYPEEKEVKTTLLEGSISLGLLSSSGDLSKAVILKPGQQARNNGSSIVTANIDAENTIDWKNGRFNFNNDRLEDIMTKLARWYDVKVIYEDENLKQKIFGGSTLRTNNISVILSKLQLTGEVRFTIKGKEVTVSQH